jgi:hypothetical protein
LSPKKKEEGIKKESKEICSVVRRIEKGRKKRTDQIVRSRVVSLSYHGAVHLKYSWHVQVSVLSLGA